MSTTDLEKTSLEAHVDLCALRYENLDRRLTNVETKLDNISDAMKAGQNSLNKVIIGAAGTIVSSLLGVVVVILMNG